MEIYLIIDITVLHISDKISSQMYSQISCEIVHTKFKEITDQIWDIRDHINLSMKDFIKI
ncbi:MAG: hypothetical protein Q8P20_09970 [bacterium]|nr:hypothetical protein [bacterium]